MTISEPISNDPFVTIAIPTFNRAALVKSCITAALAQSYPYFEVFVSDNASTDETPNVLKAFDDRRLRSTRQQTNIGLVGNWNACLAQARGEYIVFVSDDDVIEPWLLDRCIDVIRSEPGVPIVIALSDRLFSRGYTLNGTSHRRLGTGIWDGTEILAEILDGSVFAPMCTILIRTEALRARGGFPVDWGPCTLDQATWFPLLLTGRAGLVNESCGTHTIHEGSFTSGLALEVILQDTWKLVELILNIANTAIIDPRQRRDLEFRARRYFAHCAINNVGSRRREGATLLEAVSELWRWRRELSVIRPADLYGLRRSFAYILLPQTVVRFLGSINRGSGRILKGVPVA